MAWQMASEIISLAEWAFAKGQESASNLEKKESEREKIKMQNSAPC